MSGLLSFEVSCTPFFSSARASARIRSRVAPFAPAAPFVFAPFFALARIFLHALHAHPGLWPATPAAPASAPAVAPVGAAKAAPPPVTPGEPAKPSWAYAPAPPP